MFYFALLFAERETHNYNVSGRLCRVQAVLAGSDLAAVLDQQTPNAQMKTSPRSYTAMEAPHPLVVYAG